ncbi:MAG TPA: hypothetical protein EYH09_01860 [Candidatus Nanopusillus sp.]|nr:hypothetical protein [Candidatus Nanopusillus sp.]HIP90615.1 hypothetical protein [Candidatus Nanopusillus sp.]
MVAIYEGAINLLDKFGFFNIILPWILVYALTYGILLNTRIFGDAFNSNNVKEAKMARSISSMIAFAIASIVIGSYHAVTSIRGVVPLIAIFLIIVFSIILVVAAFALPEGELIKTDTYAKFKKYMGIPATILLILVILNYFGLLKGISGSGVPGSFWSKYGDYIGAILMLAAFGVIAYLLVREPKSQEQNNN